VRASAAAVGPAAGPVTRRAGASVGGSDATVAALLVAVFAAAVALRVAVGGPRPATSPAAGLVFAAALAAAALADRPGTGVRCLPSPVRRVALAVLGVALLCLPVLVRQAPTGLGAHRPGGGFAGWAAVVAVVAVAEEAFLRGVLYRRVEAAAGVSAAVAVTAVCFAGLHVPLYGWASVPLDLAVGLWLGWLRHAAGTWAVPAAVHTAVDLVAWWLR
jgi:membrane protease YdiL (CAAX protease family)